MDTKQVKAFAPGSISCVFRIVADEDPARMHSLGLGFTVEEGVVATVSRDNRWTMLFNGREVGFPTVAAVVQRLTGEPVRVELESGLPLSSGFGLSGAAALATAYALNALLEGGRSEWELAMMAHVAEVENLTGLGDVCMQFHGGCLVRLEPGKPLSAERLPVQERPIYYRYSSPIDTKQVLQNTERTACINRAADEALENIRQLMKSDTAQFEEYVAAARAFAVNSRLLTDPRVVQAIRQVESESGAASMIMLGNAVFATRPFEGAKETTLSTQRARIL